MKKQNIERSFECGAPIPTKMDTAKQTMPAPGIPIRYGQTI